MEDLKLYHIISTLNQCSEESVQSGNGFTDIDRYLHTERPETDELLEKMIKINNAGGGIILLVDSACDSESHLLSKVKEWIQIYSHKMPCTMTQPQVVLLTKRQLSNIRKTNSYCKESIE